jgi:hypothetical protein
VELVKELRVLGVWIDKGITWKSHIEKAVSKGTKALNSLSRIAAST